MANLPSAKPPAFAQWLLSRFLHDVDHDAVLGDLEEIYGQKLQQLGKQRAKHWYWLQVVRSLPPLISRTLFWSTVMLKHYFKIALRSLRKQLGYAAINIFGLAIGLTCVMLVSMFVLFERSYDTFHEKAGDIYRVAKENRINYEPSTRFTATPLPLAAALMAELPEVEFATHIRKTEVVMEHDGSRFDEAGIYTSPQFFDVFSFSLLQGNPATALSEPNAIVLTASLAKKYFGTTSPVGQPLTIIHDSAPVQMQITGVVEDVPANSHFTFDYLISITSSPRYRWDSQNWDNNGYMTYAALTPGADQATFATKLTQLAHNYLTRLDYYQRNPGEVSNYFPQALTDIHLTSHLRFEFGVNGDIKYVYLFAVIGLLILLISVINYVNLATARSATRMVEMGVRKIVGAHRKQITGQFIAEAIIPAVLALLIAIGLVFLLLPTFNALTAREMAFNPGPGALLVMISLGIGVGILAGSYPSFVMSAFQPIAMTKKMTGKNGQKSRLQQSLLIVQFAITIALIFSTLVIREQLDFIQDENTGVDRAQIVSVEIKDKALAGKYNALRQRLESHPGITSVTGSHHQPTYIFSRQSTQQWEGAPPDQDHLMIHHTPVRHNFVDMMGIELVEGRNFSEEIASDAQAGLLINQALMRELGWESAVNKQIVFRDRVNRVVGVMKDFNFLSFHEAIAPLALYINDERLTHVLVKVQPADMQQTLGFIQETMAEFSPTFPFAYAFLDDAYNNMYQTESRLGGLFTSFTLLAIFIACLGLLGLAMFSTARRTKELGVRKVLGASLADILLLLTKDLTALVVIAFVLAAPLAYFAIDFWLQSFAYRIAIGWHTFVLAGGSILLITWLTISYQSIKAAMATPLRSLRHE